MIHLIESKSSTVKGRSSTKAALVVKTKILSNEFTLFGSSEDINCKNDKHYDCEYSKHHRRRIYIRHELLVFIRQMHGVEYDRRHCHCVDKVDQVNEALQNLGRKKISGVDHQYVSFEHLNRH